jgi:hypothetical protein
VQTILGLHAPSNTYPAGSARKESYHRRGLAGERRLRIFNKLLRNSSPCPAYTGEFLLQE